MYLNRLKSKPLPNTLSNDWQNLTVYVETTSQLIYQHCTHYPHITFACMYSRSALE